ncbi:MAG: ABC transporter ATP-binding protein [Bacilli bacterium]|nr:ABC transporter ATP-binding protein [Bacilli bacterium]
MLEKENYILEMLHITKSFSGVLANDDVSLKLRKGEIHVLLGENGAGKSTLMSILFGLYDPTYGEIKINGETVRIKNPNDARKYHIGMVHQHFKLVECISVLKNIIIGVEPFKEYKYVAKEKPSLKDGSSFWKKIIHFFKVSWFYISQGISKFLDICLINKLLTYLNKKIFHFIDYKKAREDVLAISKKYHLDIELDALISDITVGMQQRVEILKMLYRENDILIFDEPTAVLTPQEIDELMKIMKNLTSEGKSIIFITHKMKEIFAVGDRCSILRKGKYVGTVNIADVNENELSDLMVGHHISLELNKKPANPTDVVLDVKNLVIYDKQRKIDKVKDVSFNVRKGEIVCIAGIDGNGQSDLIFGLTGLESIKSGQILLNGTDISSYSIKRRNNAGMAHIPEDRHKHGLILDYRLDENIALGKQNSKEFSRFGFINFKARKQYANMIIEKYDVRSLFGVYSNVRGMSGGNQQKAIIGREIEKNGDLLIAVQPTRGLDVGAVTRIHEQLIEQRDLGKAILLVSFEMDEVLNLSDRILVMHDGKIQGELESSKTNAREIGLYMIGAKGEKHE